ncbi:MAG TPA: hypothetical protein VGG03_16785 [Thermoanaerobaculia bacterium]|jgi:hypothetical protein
MFWLALVISLLSVILLSVLYYRFPNLQDTLKFLGAGLGLTAAIASAIFTYLQVAEATKQSQLAAQQIAEAGKQSRLAFIHSQREQAFVLIYKYNNLPLQIASDFIDSIEGKTPEEINNLQRRDRRTADALRACMSFFENASLALQSGFASEDIACEHFRDTSVLYYERLKGFVDVYRIKTKSPDAWKHYQWLYDQWKNGCPGLKAAAGG